MSSGSVDDVPSTIFCHFFELEHADVMMDVLDFSSTDILSSLNDSHHLIDDMSDATEVKNDHVTDEELRAMKEMVASMRRNPELLHQSTVMQRASCLTSSSLRCDKTDKASPGEADVVKNEDLCAMKDMVASMRKNPLLLYQSPIMQKASFISDNARALTHNAPSHISSPITTTLTLNTSARRPLGTKFDPSSFPSLPFDTSVCIGSHWTQFEQRPPSSGSKSAFRDAKNGDYGRGLEFVKSSAPRSRRRGSIVEVSYKRFHASETSAEPPRNPATAAEPPRNPTTAAARSA